MFISEFTLRVEFKHFIQHLKSIKIVKPIKKIKIIFLLPSLVPGGAERVISFVAQNIDKEKFIPTLLIAGFQIDSSYDVSHVDVIYLNKKRILTAIPLIVLNIIKIKPDIVVSSISHVNTAMSLISPFFKDIKFIGREATILSKRKNENKKRTWSPINFIPNGFKNLDMLICQSQDMALDMIKNYNMPKHKVHVINNPISSLNPIKKTDSPSKIKKYITVGRLTEIKGHIRILNILSKLNTPFEYTIIGDGILKEGIFEHAKKLDIYQYIKYIPFTNNVSYFLSESDIFLQGSYVEGFPNALLEGNVVGIPSIAFDVPGGTKEIIINGVNGFLVNNENEFLEKLQENREWYPREIRKLVYKKFNKEKIINQYETLFLEILKQ